MSNQYAIRQNIEHVIFKRFKYYEQSSSNQTSKDYKFRKRKINDKRTFSNFITLKIIVIKRKK